MYTSCPTASAQTHYTGACRAVWAPPARPMISSLGKQSPLRQFAAVRASAQDVGMLLAAAADEAAKAAEAVKPGSVEAPSGALIVGAILVTLALTAGIPALLSPGNKAAEQIFDRDSKTGRR